LWWRAVCGPDHVEVWVTQSDEDLLAAIGGLHNQKLTRAGLLLAGSPEAIHRLIPTFGWTHLRMRGDTDYTDRVDGTDALPVGLHRLLDRILADNPLQTVAQGLFHFEYRTYPEIALREVLLNALCHADFRLASPIMVKQYRGHIEITNPGGFIGGITPDNILHHAAVPRNPCLVDALVRLRLVNRSNLGIPRIFASLLVEGKEPPLIEEVGESVRLTLRASDLSAPFRAFVAEEGKRGIDLSVDQLLILQRLLRHPEIDTQEAARLCQRPGGQVREVLSAMERDLGYLERGGRGRATYWTLRPELHRRLGAPGLADRNRRLDWEAAKTRVLSVLRHRASRGEPGLSNTEIRQITLLDRGQVKRLMTELAQEQVVILQGRGRGAVWLAVTQEDHP